MKKYLMILTTLIFTANVALTITISINATNEYYYGYPFNSFSKVEDTMSLSKNHKNVIYFMIDMTTGFDVTSILQSNEKMTKNFTGFINKQNVITTNWGTNASVPNIFGGFDYDVYHKNHGNNANITLKQYMRNANNVLYSDFGKSNYNISAVANQYYDYNEKKSYWDSNTETLEHDFKNQNLKAINANDITRYLAFQHPEIYKKLNLPAKIYEKSTNANYIAITSYLSHVKIENTEKNKFMTIMDESNHIPIVMDENGNYQKKELTIENVYNSTKGFLTKINDFISYLKANNIYDNTMIVIVSDHGNATGSLPITNKKYNHSGIDYSDIAKINQKYPGFTRAFPTLLVKPFNSNEKIRYDNKYLYTNADALTFIKENNKNDVNFEMLDKTKDPRYLKQLSDIKNRNNRLLPSYRNDSLWDDSFTKYLTPNSAYGGHSFLVKKSIFNLANYFISKDTKDYYSPDNLEHWIKLQNVLKNKSRSNN